MSRRIMVFGPAYLDRVVHVDRPLVDPALGPPLDQSVDGHWKFGPGLTLVDPRGSAIVVDLPGGWTGPTGSVTLSRPLAETTAPWRRSVRAMSWRDDLGGMGAGFAAALGGDLICALGPEDDPTSRTIAEGLEQAGIAYHPVRLEGQVADWTLLLTSGEFGDKLAIGSRDCHAALTTLAPWEENECTLRVVASLPNPVAAEALRAAGAKIRFFAPSSRNMSDDGHPVAVFADAIDVLSCNRREWERLATREEVAWKVSILIVTDGPEGSTVRFTRPSGDPGEIRQPAFPRSKPPKDTNRAGEAFASTFLSTLLEEEWTPGIAEEALVRRAAELASAASALVLDRLDFGFPGLAAIDAALLAGRV